MINEHITDVLLHWSPFNKLPS